MINIIDNAIYDLIIKTLNPNITGAMIFISYLGSAITLITLSIAFIFLLKNKKDSKMVILNLVFVFLINRLLKIIVSRPRPQLIQLVQEKGYSFPSGHAMISMGFYGFLIYLICTKIKNKKTKYPLIVFLALLILLIGISRIYLGVHYATDIIGGFIIGFIYLILFIKYIYNKKRKS